MLAVPCGLPAYMGPWPPVVGGRLVSPLAELAACTPHLGARSFGHAADESDAAVGVWAADRSRDEG